MYVVDGDTGATAIKINGLTYSPTQIGAGTTWLAIDSGAAYFVAATKTDGTLWL